MNYYKRHLGDYARKAGHLSMLEHGAYNLILDQYYDREVAPTRAEAIRYARARSAIEIAAVDVVLAEFFVEQDERFYQSRVEQEFDEAAVQAEKNRENGKRGGRPRKSANASVKPKITQPVISDNPTANPNESQKNPNPLIHKSTNPEEAKAFAQPSASRFGEWWNAYPKKVGRKKAEQLWNRRRLDGIADRLVADVTHRAANDDGWQRGYAPDPCTYINQDRWEDAIRDPPRAAAPTAAPSKTLSAIQQLEAMKNGQLAGNRITDRVPEIALLGTGPYSGD